MKILRQETIPSRLEYLQKSLALVSSCASDLGSNQKKYFEIELAAWEALVNIITHAYNGKEGMDNGRCSICI
jgi:anti-sigma regulatory factor (Ser/Thr protein kinase)